MTAPTLSPSACLEVEEIEEVVIDLYEKYTVVYLWMNTIGPRGVSEQSSLVSLYQEYIIKREGERPTPV